MKDQDQFGTDVEYEIVKALPSQSQAPAVQSQSPFARDGGIITKEDVERAETLATLLPQIKRAAFKVTSEKDWVNFAGRAYLTESGCMKIAGLFGVSFLNTKVASHDEETPRGPKKTFRAMVTAVCKGREITQLGEVDSDFKFYAQKSGATVPFEERNFSHMAKHAITNAMNRSLKSILGISGIPWSEVEAALGREKAGAAGNVNFKQSAAAAKPQTVAQAEAGDLRKKLSEMLLDLSNNDAAGAANILKKETSFEKDGKTVDGFTDPMNPKISDKWITAAYHKIKKLWEPTFGGPPQEEPGSNG